MLTTVFSNLGVYTIIGLHTDKQLKSGPLLALSKQNLNHGMSHQNDKISIYIPITRVLSSFLASGYFCPLLITFANSLDPDQD